MTSGYQPKDSGRDPGPPPQFETSGRSPDQEMQRLRALVYVPGLWRCPKCEFHLMQANLNAGDGSVTPRDTPGDKCPNCDGPLWRVSERDAGNEMAQHCEVLQFENAALHDVNDWRSIDSVPPDNRLILAGCPPCDLFAEGRVMLWSADILRRSMKSNTPGHLRFPATHWKPAPAPPQRSTP